MQAENQKELEQQLKNLKSELRILKRTQLPTLTRAVSEQKLADEIHAAANSLQKIVCASVSW